MDDGTLKTSISKCRLYWSFCLGWWSNFVGSESGQKQSVKLPAEYGLQHNSTPPPPPDSHILSVYTVHLVWEGGGTVREKVEGQQYTSYQQICTNHEWMFLQSIKSVKHNAANSINMSILKKSRHWGFGVFKVHLSMLSNFRATFARLGDWLGGWDVGCLFQDCRLVWKRFKSTFSDT